MVGVVEGVVVGVVREGARVRGGGGMYILAMTSFRASLEGMYCLRGTRCL